MENLSTRMSIPLPILTGKNNYESWSKKMKTFFRWQDLSHVIDGTVNHLRKDDQALFAIQQAVADEIFPKIRDAKSAKEAWDTLNSEFAKEDDIYKKLNDNLIDLLAMDTFQTYKAILEEDWDAMAYFFTKNIRSIISPMTIHNDCALHMAVYSKKNRPLKDLIEPAVMNVLSEFWFLQVQGDETGTNLSGNTALHEAAMVGNLDAVKALMETDEDEVLIGSKNNKGETPLFRAAAYGQNKIVDLLASKIHGNEWEEHRQREDSTSILLIAVQGENFDTAMLLHKLDKKFLTEWDAGRDKTGLLRLEDKSHKTVYDFLPDMPHAFKSGCQLDVLDKFLYHFMFIDDDDVDGAQETATKDRLFSHFSTTARKVLKVILRCNFFPKGRIWEEKRRHKCASKFVKLIIKDEIDRLKTERNSKNQTRLSVLLFRATSTGIIEIVKEILEQCPQCVELLNEDGQNLLHVAIMHRQRKIFDLLKQWPVALHRLNQKIDNDGYTLLHHVADNKHYTGGTRPGPAFQLQEELEWFEDVKDIIPRHFVVYRNNTENKTAKELFKMNHKEQLKEAQEWIKETSQSCSAVAVLVATVVFAAIYTVPGDVNESGIPRFINLPYFIVFTTLDVISLASSLTAVVIFLSVLSSPFELQDFYHTLPRKLMLGFLLLFFSVVTTTLTFTFTIILIFRLQKKWTRGLVSMAAFLPVLIFCLSQFHLYRACFDGINKQCFEPGWHATRKQFRRCIRFFKYMDLKSFQFGRKDGTPNAACSFQCSLQCGMGSYTRQTASP